MHVSDEQHQIRVCTRSLADIPPFDVFKVNGKFYRKHKKNEVREQKPGAQNERMPLTTRVLWVGVIP